jgi:hypothetical protein
MMKYMYCIFNINCSFCNNLEITNFSFVLWWLSFVCVCVCVCVSSLAICEWFANKLSNKISMCLTYIYLLVLIINNNEQNQQAEFFV